jgi:hypothetical protein
MSIERPNFATASDDEMKRYLQGLWQWPDTTDMERHTRELKDAERELIDRGHKDYMDYYRNMASR